MVRMSLSQSCRREKGVRGPCDGPDLPSLLRALGAGDSRPPRTTPSHRTPVTPRPTKLRPPRPTGTPATRPTTSHPPGGAAPTTSHRRGQGSTRCGRKRLESASTRADRPPATGAAAECRRRGPPGRAESPRRAREFPLLGPCGQESGATNENWVAWWETVGYSGPRMRNPGGRAPPTQPPGFKFRSGE